MVVARSRPMSMRRNTGIEYRVWSITNATRPWLAMQTCNGLLNFARVAGPSTYPAHPTGRQPEVWYQREGATGRESHVCRAGSFEAGGRAYAVDEAIASAGQRGGYRGVCRRRWHLGIRCAKEEHAYEQPGGSMCYLAKA
eukprot:scaffold55258_cov59-Phaeocystis_antarctica.AAC.5